MFSTARARVAVGLCTVLVASGVALGGGIASAADRNCDDFNSQSEAQTYFVANGGSAANNFNNLDRDHDGTACEDYDYSTKTPTTSPSTSPTTAASTEPTEDPATSSSTADDGSTAATDGSQVSEVPQGSADTGSW